MSQSSEVPKKSQSENDNLSLITESYGSSPTRTPIPSGMSSPRVTIISSENRNLSDPNTVPEIALDAWVALGKEDDDSIENSVTDMNYVNTSVGQKVAGENKPAKVVESQLEFGFECTESVESIQSAQEALPSSVTSIRSVYEEIQHCEDVNEISRLLELDQRDSSEDVNWGVRIDSNTDITIPHSILISSTSNSSTSRRKHIKILGSIASRNPYPSQSKSSNKKQMPKKKVEENKSRRVSPGRKIIVCDGKVGLIGFDELDRTRDTSPYKSIFFDSRHPPPKGKTYHQVNVSEKEYRLIQQNIPPPTKRKVKISTQPPEECKRTLFGWVGCSSTETSPPSSPITFGEIPLKFCRSRSRLGQFTTASDTELRHKASCPLPRRTDNKETQTVKKAIDFIKTVGNIEDISDELIAREIVDSLKDILEGSDEMNRNCSTGSIDQTSLETTGQNMCSEVFCASETSVVLINTVFKDVVQGSDVPSSLASSPKFKQFISSSNEMDALERAAEIYTSAAKKIQEYLDNVRKGQIPFQNKSKLESARASKVVLPESSNTSLHNRKAGTENANSEGLPKLERQASNLSNVWSFAPELNPEKFEMSLTSRPGILMETIDCNNWQFSISYSGGPEKINLLGTATREKSEPVFLKPQCLLEMIDRNSSFACGRLISSKYSMSRVCFKIERIVQQFLNGKYSKNSNKFKPRLITKLRRINVFSGILFQLSVPFLSVCRKIQSAIEKAMKLDDVLRCPRLPGIKLIVEEAKTQKYEVPLPTGAKMPMREAIQELSLCMGEIDSILECGKYSLASINLGVKVKKEHKKIIKIMYDAMKQLEFSHDVDFGTVIMSLACNASVIQSLSDIVPTVDLNVRSMILSNLGHLHGGAEDVVKLSKRLTLLSSFIAGKSFLKLSKHNQIEAAKKKLKRQKRSDKKGKSSHRDRSISNQKTLERIVERRRMDEMKRQEELNEQLERLNASMG